MASTLKVDQIETPSGVGNISFAQPISGDGSQLTGVGLAVGGGAVVAGDFLYHDGTEWTRLPKGTAAQYLRMNAGATAPEWIATTGAGIQVPAASAAGDILYYDGSNYVRLAKGTAAQTLAMNSGATAPEWVTPGGGGAWNMITSLTASNSASLEFTTGITSTYKMYCFVIANLQGQTAASNAFMYIGYSGSYQGSSYHYKTTTDASNSTGFSAVSNNGGPGFMLGDQWAYGSGIVWLPDPADTVNKKMVNWSCTHRNAGGDSRRSFGGGQWQGGTNAIDRVKFDVGTMPSGRITMYGIAHA